MSVDDILKIIDAIPDYIKYIYPGYLTMYIFCFLKGRTLKDSNYVLMKSVAISYLFILVEQMIAEKIDLRLLGISYALKENMCLILLSIAFSYGLYRITISDYIQNTMGKVGIITTFYDNEIEVLSNYNKGAWLCVYLKDDSVVYEGSLGYKELEEGKRKYICLNAYYKYLLDEDGKPKEPYIEDHENELDETVLIFYDDIKRIEKRKV